MLSINTYKMVQHLKNAGINEAQAVAIQETVISMREADIEKLATKDDLKQTEQKLQKEIQTVDMKIDNLALEIRNEFKLMREEFRNENKLMRDEFRNENKLMREEAKGENKLIREETKTESAKNKADMYKVIFAATLSIIGVVLAAAKFIR